MGTDPVVLVTGGAGQVALALRKELPSGRYLPHDELDVTDESAVHEAAKGADVIVHLAAMTDVNGCERDPLGADRVNGLGTGNVVAAAESVGARVVYVSTNYVFDGAKVGEYDEEDRPAPLSAYGRSKLAGEAAVRRREGHLVVRTSWVFGGERDFVRTILEAARRDGEIEVIDDQAGRPTWSGDLASALAHLVRGQMTGLVHVAGDGEPASRADLARATLYAAAVKARITDIDTASYLRKAADRVAPRPANGVLSVDKARREGVALGDWRRSLARYLGDLS